MCGFVGLVGDPLPYAREALTDLIERMSSSIARRGPDDAGVFVDAHARCALGFRRLSILDLSPAGHQPMRSADGRYVIAFNGEVYSHDRLREDLVARGVRFRGHSDTEVLVEAFACFGPDVVRRFEGMFAIALWDERERVLRLFRDHVGKKPLYYGRIGRAWTFASQLAPFHLVPGFERRVDRGALQAFLRYACVPAPSTIFEGVQQLMPGHVVEITPGAEHARARPFFEARTLVDQPAFSGSESEAIEAVDAALMRAVKRRMVADVPIGAFLSGGIDSSLVVAAMQASSPTHVRTFTIGYDEAAYDEAQHASEIASHLGTSHTSLRVSPREALDVIPELPSVYDEPFADASQIPTLLVSRLARRDVTVVLSGDGGDEGFGGYNRYFEAPKLFALARRLPPPLRRRLFDALGAVPSTRWDALLARARPALPPSVRGKLTGDRIQKASSTLASARTLDDVYLALLSNHRHPEDFVLGGVAPVTSAEAPPPFVRGLDPVSRMMMLDTLVYLPNDILVKVDRATMASSLEARAPLLDLEVLRLAWSLPLALKVRDGGKWILREVLARRVPRSLFERPKRGFGVPIEHWLRTDLRGWAEDLLAPDALVRDGFFDAARVRALFREHLRGINHQARLWPILMFQQWRRAWLSP